MYLAKSLKLGKPIENSMPICSKGASLSAKSLVTASHTKVVLEGRKDFLARSKGKVCLKMSMIGTRDRALFGILLEKTFMLQRCVQS